MRFQQSSSDGGFFPLEELSCPSTAIFAPMGNLLSSESMTQSHLAHLRHLRRRSKKAQRVSNMSADKRGRSSICKKNVHMNFNSTAYQLLSKPSTPPAPEPSIGYESQFPPHQRSFPNCCSGTTLPATSSKVQPKKRTRDKTRAFPCFWAFLSNQSLRFLYVPRPVRERLRKRQVADDDKGPLDPRQCQGDVDKQGSFRTDVLNGLQKDKLSRDRFKPDQEQQRASGCPLIGTSLFDLLHPADAARFKKDFECFMDLRTLQGRMIRVRMKNLFTVDEAAGTRADFRPSELPNTSSSLADRIAEWEAQNTNPVLVDVGLNAIDENCVLAFFHVGQAGNENMCGEHWREGSDCISETDVSDISESLTSILQYCITLDHSPYTSRSVTSYIDPLASNSRFLQVLRLEDLSLIHSYPPPRFAAMTGKKVKEMAETPNWLRSLLHATDEKTFRELLTRKGRRNTGITNKTPDVVSTLLDGEGSEDGGQYCTRSMFYLQHRVKHGRSATASANATRDSFGPEQYVEAESIVFPYGSVVFICTQAFGTLAPAADKECLSDDTLALVNGSLEALLDSSGYSADLTMAHIQTTAAMEHPPFKTEHDLHAFFEIHHPPIQHYAPNNDLYPAYVYPPPLDGNAHIDPASISPPQQQALSESIYTDPQPDTCGTQLGENGYMPTADLKWMDDQEMRKMFGTHFETELLGLDLVGLNQPDLNGKNDLPLAWPTQEHLNVPPLENGLNHIPSSQEFWIPTSGASQLPDEPLSPVRLDSFIGSEPSCTDNLLAEWSAGGSNSEGYQTSQPGTVMTPSTLSSQSAPTSFSEETGTRSYVPRACYPTNDLTPLPSYNWDTAAPSTTPPVDAGLHSNLPRACCPPTDDLNQFRNYGWNVSPSTPIATENFDAEQHLQQQEAIGVVRHRGRRHTLTATPRPAAHNAFLADNTEYEPAALSKRVHRRFSVDSSCRPYSTNNLKRDLKPKVCESCSITESPEWRRGPSGQKT
ncbi:hypothetical protein DFS34DRAFT_589057 [Phlyctochytrium arcticum]|nr:hypothetical protein DFS34DRAFT_589057 [Phlyctochytrium arcticum]